MITVHLSDSIQHVIAYPISRGKLINFVAFISRHDKENTKFDGPWVAQADQGEFAGRFSRWEPEVQALVNVSLCHGICARGMIADLVNHLNQCADQPLRWAIHTVKPLSTFVHSRVALIGDAVCLILMLFLRTKFHSICRRMQCSRPRARAQDKRLR